MPSFAIVLPSYTLLLLLTMVAIAAIFNGIRNPCDGIVSQHFLLTAAARSLSLGQVLRLSDEEAHAKFVEIRFAENEGGSVLPALWFCQRLHDPDASDMAMQGLQKAVLGNIGNNLCEPQAADPGLPRRDRDLLQ
jgi:hypothetical protein